MAQEPEKIPGSKFNTAPAPAWVIAQPVPLEVQPPEGGLERGQHFLLVDRQVRIEGAWEADYRHLAIRAANEQGVESLATLSIAFNPTVETLQIHSVQVLRNGKALPQRQPLQWQMLRRESRMEQLVFDGSLTATLVLQDIRVADVVEYRFTRRSRNPVFNGLHHGGFDHQWTVPAERVHARLLWPRERKLQLLSLNKAPPPSVQAMGAYDEYRWQVQQVPALNREPQAPDWYDPFPWTQWSEYPDWQAVARWAVPLYAVAQEPQGAVRQEVERIRKAHASPEQQLLAALRFVQGEVRYLAVMLGEGSHAPNAPEVVLQRRYGDCKDKTRLLLALLRGLGLEAQAALVHTERGRGIADWGPTPSAFNHVLVRASLDGQAVWMDPTRHVQAVASLSKLVQSDHGLALVINPSSSGLVSMASPHSKLDKRRVHLFFDGGAGLDEPVNLTVTTTSEGSAADSMRASAAGTSKAELLKTYASFYSNSFSGLSPNGELEIRDEPEENRFTTVERYSVNKFWQSTAKSTRVQAWIEIPDLLQHLKLPTSHERVAPVSLRHPVDLTLITELKLPKDWNVEPTAIAKNEQAFSLQRDEVWTGKRHLQLTDRFQTKLDHIEAKDLAALHEQFDATRKALHYSLTYDTSVDASQGPHWQPLLFGVFSVAGLAWLARKIYRWDPAPMPFQPLGPEGRSGWLLLPMLGMPWSAWLNISSLMETAPSFEVSTWMSLTQDSGSSYHPLWLPVLLLSLLATLVLLGCVLMSLLLFALKRSSFPKVYIVTLVLGALASAFDHLSTYLIPALSDLRTEKATRQMVLTFVSSFLWTAYFLRSSRVANTFRQRWAPATAAGSANATDTNAALAAPSASP